MRSTSMTGGPLGLRWPRLIGVRLTGALSGWASPKDVILRVAEILTVRGGTGAIVEYFGPGTSTISATGKATICNMGAEIGATTSIFPYDDRSRAYLAATDRAALAEAADAVAADLRADDEVAADPTAFFDEVIEIDLADPRAPRRRPAHARPGPPRLGPRRRGPGAGLAAGTVPGPRRLVHQLVLRGHQPGGQRRPPGHGAGPAGAHAPAGHAGLRRGPGHGRARRSAGRPRGRGRHRPGQRLRAVHRPVGRAPTWSPGRATRSSPRSTATSPSATTATSRPWRSSPPPRRRWPTPWPAPSTSTPSPTRSATARSTEPVGRELPPGGFDAGDAGFIAPPAEASSLEVVVDPTSSRIQLLEPFPPNVDDVLPELRVLLKARGKCTTDHISAAGKWLRFRGHLENISANLFLGATNAFTGEAGTGWCDVHQAREPFPEVARHYKDAGHALGRHRRRELRRGVVARARRHGAPVHGRAGGHRPLLRPHRRDQPQEAGHPAPGLHRPGDLRRDRRARPDLDPRARPTSPPTSPSPAGSTVPTAPPSTSPAPTP